MGRRIIPHQQVDTVLAVDMDGLRRSGIRYLMIDVDNTLVPTGASVIPDDIRRWIDEAKKRFDICLLSNSKKKRISMLAGTFGVCGVYYSMKPFGWGYRKAARILGAENPAEVCIIGDQLYTDIWLGMRMGCHTVLVTPCSKVDHFWTRALRRMEEKTLRHMPQGDRKG